MSAWGTNTSTVTNPFFPGADPNAPGGRLLLVAPNIVSIEREPDVEPADFRLWVCLHEETHRVQFTGVPWMQDYFRSLVDAKRGIWLIMTEHGKRLLSTESDVSDVSGLRAHVGAKGWDQLVTVFDDDDRGATPASGSAKSSGMVVCPCSMGTLSAIAAGSSRSLSRARM